jgi:Holliday junction resolvasome RuvABC endonuclease subunit
MNTWIGIDPATSCGWAVLSPGGTRIASGRWQLERRRGDGAGMLYVRFERLFRELLAGYPGAIVAYEQVANHHVGSAHVGLGIMAHLQRICEELVVPYSGMSPATIKRHATGKGVAKKESMVAAAVARWGEVSGDDEADALFIADAARVGLA